ncbi:MAG: cytochrome c oxidase assembly protein [Amycolatopsis sp.]|uniref:cytochrome c oxidase assembly protein n=1 Tax=Amycolatopsis sp. TaxID=37632 RepID=UPI00263030FD|nr:cytochrome c oxidase assembly protein [Amycolatopsis sp.]MCU1682993.1 cytochrome c oxidase assembly protein [Amycolatopsis sp.]
METGAIDTPVSQSLPPLTVGRVLTAWQFDVPAIVGVVVLGALYLMAVRRVGSWPHGRVVSFFGGLATLLVVTCSFIGTYDGTLFWARAVQVTTLLMVAPLFLALGAPLTLLMATVPSTVGARLRRIGRGRAARTLTFPLVVTLVLVVPPFVIYLTPLYELCLRNSVVDGLVKLVVLGAGFIYFWTRVQLDPTPREDSHLVSVWIALTEVIFDGVLGLVIWLGPLVAPDYYEAIARTWGPDLRIDQIIGAGVLWIGGDVAGLPFVAALFVRWSRDDNRKAKEIDAELDAEEAQAAESVEAGEASAKSGLWWENDPVLAERFKRR